MNQEMHQRYLSCYKHLAESSAPEEEEKAPDTERDPNPPRKETLKGFPVPRKENGHVL